MAARRQVTTERDYVLGTHDEEIARLGLQHRVWRPRVSDAWRRAGFSTGQTLLDVGCGPGWAALDLAEIVGPGGRVVAMDRSRRFLDALERVRLARGLAQLTAVELDLDEAGALPARGADGAWARWVFAFVREPRRLLERVVAALRPGGALVLFEYIDYRTWRLSPREPDFESFVAEVMASWREQGGEPDIGLELPRWLAELGCDIRSEHVICDVSRPGDAVWPWPEAFVEVGVQRLVDVGRLTPARGAAIREAFARTARTPHAFLTTPMTLELVAVRRG